MNKLILIGNGFDLTHQMKTSYKDFLINQMLSLLHIALGELRVENENFTITNNMDFYQSNEIRNIVKDIKHYERAVLDIFSNLEIIKYKGNEYHNGLKIKIRNPILEKDIHSCHRRGWTDIEQTYYNELIKIASSGAKNKTEEIIELNQSLENIKNNLYNYLKALPPTGDLKYMYHAFNARFNESDFLYGSPELEKCDHMLILNFNYTYTPEIYLRDLSTEFEIKPTIESIHIHGELKNRDNPLIFGFGDEMDEHYKILEKMDNKCLDNMKSFGYFRTDNLRKLSRFLEDDEYQVQIMGHSCGLSDRVMLNRIFEHEHCRSIKIFHHRKGYTFEETNYKELTQNISRHFNKKQMMRDRVVPYDENNFLPQH